MFETQFANIPSVNATYSNSISSVHSGNISISVINITLVGCDIYIKNNSTANYIFHVTWNAYAQIA